MEGDILHLIGGTDGSLRISPYDPAFETQMRLAREGMAQYRHALRELAQGKSSSGN